jgi:hypothetical protein
MRVIDLRVHVDLPAEVGAPSSMPSRIQVEQFIAALNVAKSLPQDLLLPEQQHALYGLFKQSDSPAPPSPPAEAKAAIAKARRKSWRACTPAASRARVCATVGCVGRCAKLGPGGGHAALCRRSQ